LNDADNDENQQQQHDDAHQDDEPANRCVALSYLIYTAFQTKQPFPSFEQGIAIRRDVPLAFG